LNPLYVQDFYPCVFALVGVLVIGVGGVFCVLVLDAFAVVLGVLVIGVGVCCVLVAVLLDVFVLGAAFVFCVA